jgi:hypothetical protein
MKPKLGICIPYRNRKEHIEELIPRLTEHLNKMDIPHKFYVGHQVDDKLFNRGAMKNIAAYHAFEDGCDYIAWHDVDMVPHDDNCDYSYPNENPVHIATKLSKYEYKLGYEQYFGGVILFTKDQVEKTNGYSNDYWDWGQEDDDLFWRAYYEGLTTYKVFEKHQNRKVAQFNGNDSYLAFKPNREISSCLHQDHTISILFSADQQPDKVPIWLVGDDERKFIEYPLIRKDGSHNWGISFNNSRAVTSLVYDRDDKHHYNYAKRFENEWTWVTVTYDSENGNSYLYINDELNYNVNGVKEAIPLHIDKKLKIHDSVKPILLGVCTLTGVFLKGKIAEVKIYNKFFEDVNLIFEDNNDLVLHYNFDVSEKDIVNDYEFYNNNTIFVNEDIEVKDLVLPYRREGSFDCIYHKDEGFVNGKWAKGETTARNEKRFVTEMQQNKINYKEEGYNKILDVTELVDINETLYPNTRFINVKMK